MIISDNVGDNVGDCWHGTNLFETYAVTIVATMVLASIFQATAMMIYPLAIGSCIIASIIGTFLLD